VDVDDDTTEEKGVVVPVMLNCWDWARILTPVGFSWTKLIWKPLPVGQPLDGPSTVVEPPEEGTFSFKVALKFGVDCCRRIMGKRGSRLGGNATETNHVNQDDGEVGGVSADGTPGDGLGPLAGIPGGILARAGDGEGQGGGSEEEGSGEGGEGTHDFGWKGDGRKKGEARSDGGRATARLRFFKS